MQIFILDKHLISKRYGYIREILGHAHGFDDYEYGLQTIKDNVRLLTSELLDDIFLYHILSNKKHKIGIRALILTN